MYIIYIYIIYNYIIQIKESATAHRASMQENIDYITPEHNIIQ